MHFSLLKFFALQGLVITRIHRTVRFHQSAFFESYIAFNSRKRKEATNDWAKGHFKNLNNSLFGKTMENIRHRIKFGLVNTAEEHKKLVAVTPLSAQ